MACIKKSYEKTEKYNYSTDNDSNQLSHIWTRNRKVENNRKAS
ncbi:hypothetical protein T190130A13A_20676 [Tenacibaculum sp. 190130A14a]|uniref:Uncharacterized protein n=1 Tax=Tenacibaculum polynesiense TaxID=3137857 RepID=A0ABM9P9I0_9FLAO